MKRVAVGIIREDGKFILARRPENDSLGNLWEFPGGLVPEGNSHEEALKNHLMEKFNIDCVVGEKLAVVNQEYDGAPIEITAYQVDPISKKIKLAEHLAYRWVRWNMFKEFECVPSLAPMLEILKQQGL